MDTVVRVIHRGRLRSTRNCFEPVVVGKVAGGTAVRVIHRGRLSLMQRPDRQANC